MFSATKFVVAGAIVALFGGFLLSGVLTQQQGDELAPAALTESASPEGTDQELVSSRAVDFSGTFPSIAAKSLPGYGDGPDGFVVTGEMYEGKFSDLDDPRLNGKLQIVINRIDHNSAGDVASYAVRISNDAGSWLGTGHGYNDTSNPEFVFDHWKLVFGSLDTTIFHGTGAYTGLSAIMEGVPTDDGTRVIGVVFPGEIPEIPEMPAASE
jgi:hypothetical protein